MLAGAQDHVDGLVPGPQLLGQEVQRGGAVAATHQQAGAELGRKAERPAQRPDDVQDVVGLRADQPLGARPYRVQNDLQGPGPAPPTRGLVDGERPT